MPVIGVRLWVARGEAVSITAKNLMKRCPRKKGEAGPDGGSDNPRSFWGKPKKATADTRYRERKGPGEVGTKKPKRVREK